MRTFIFLYETQISQEVFPYPPYDTTKFNTIFFIPMPAVIVLGFIFIVPSIMRNVVSERHTGIKASHLQKNIHSPLR